MGNIQDPYAVSMVHESGIAVGHVPRKILAVCSLFLLQGGSINCKVTEILEENLRAIYIHCHAHQVNLVLIDTCKNFKLLLRFVLLEKYDL